ncbi:xanthine dehydrogenase family protein molybdopterin-binding subunit [Sulfitobacter aestuariivivens]|uniref:Xanthine dehydrogenase family protein molybdopterin-binding subunit n=1 Tax=Sulfitobacter aestuariivivens TaxID=2766981 RepID=A0A927D6X3_9RHOB|nr:xanthine dehydrogenase family protein molybdopterin-binding subunit [Sulfitobacter aestuariivivens]MBD3663901.1 xanthine dehydrogenase family protein molybdopterin-binding subunit [Sulfitobacter aestuariivivens]
MLSNTPNRESPTFLKGQGRYAADVAPRGALHVAFVRNPVGAGKIVELDTSLAAAAPDVLGVYRADDVAHLGELSVNQVIPAGALPRYPVLAGPDVGAVGQPIAAVVARTAMAAADAVEQVIVEIDELAVPDEEIAAQSWSDGDIDAAFTAAALVVETTITHPRLAPSPMEPRAVCAAFDPATDSLTVWQSTQTPHRSRSELAAILNVDARRIRVIAQHVGGAFGMKGSIYPEEVFVVWAALQLRQTLVWTASRSEEFLSATQGRGIQSEGALAVDAAGEFLGLRARIVAPIGPWVPNSGLIPAWNAGRMLPSGYAVGAVDIETRAVRASGGITGIYRGAGRPEANCLMERLVDKAARALNVDPVRLRLQNLLSAEALPRQTPTGNLLDSGDYSGALCMMMQQAGYADLIRQRDARRAQGALVGLGVAFYLEPSGEGWESARVTLSDGNAVIASGSSSQGHGRETTYAKIASGALELPADAIEVVMGDTGLTPAGIGALASRATAIGGSAVLDACQQAAAARAAGADLPLTAEVVYCNKGQAWGYGAYLVMLSICAETGQPTIEAVTCVDDAGRIINDAQVQGQIIGGFTQGFGEAMMERVVYDADGQLLTGSFMDYAMPRAADVPPLDIHKMQTPSPTNLLGAKGVGEAGTIGAPAAILNAAIDALSPLGIEDLTMPLTPHRLWDAIQDAMPGEAT